MLADIGISFDPSRKGRGQRFGDVGRDALRALGIAVRQHDDEFVAAEPAQHVFRPDLLAQALRQLDQELVAGGVAERVVDVLEMIDVEEGQRDMAAGRTGVDRSGDQMPQLRAIGQAGEDVVIGEPRDLRARLLALDREGAEVDAGLDDAPVPVARRPGLAEIESEGGDDPAVLGLDRGRPAGPQPNRQRHCLVRLPARIGIEIGGQHRLAVEGGGAAGADTGPDGDTIECAGIVLGQARAAEGMDQSGGIDVKQRADDIGSDLLDAAAQPVGDLGDRHLVGERAHVELLERAQLLGLGDVFEQREDVPDPALLVAKRVDPGADPDLLAVLVVDQHLGLAAPATMRQALDEPGNGVAIGMAACDELACAAPFSLVAGVTEQRRERRINVDDVLFDIGDDDRAVGLVGDGVEQPDPDAALGIGGDVAREHDVMGCAVDRCR